MDSHRLIYFEPKCFNALIDIFWLPIVFWSCTDHAPVHHLFVLWFIFFSFFSVCGGNTLDAEYILNLGMA